MASSVAVVADADGPKASEINLLRTDCLDGQQLWIAASMANITGSGAMYGDYPVARLTSGGLSESGVTFRVPDNFVAISEAVLVVIPRATQSAANWDIASNYGGNGQAYQTHTGADNSTTYNVTNNQIFEVNVASILGSIAAGDYVGVRLTVSTSGHDADLLGLRFAYTISSKEVSANILSDEGDYNSIRSDMGTTRESWVMADLANGGASTGVHGEYATVKLTAVGHRCEMQAYMPSNFNTLTKCAIVVIPKASVTANWDINSDYAANGSTRGTHSESDTSTTYGVTDDQIYEVDVADILSSLAAGDWLSVSIDQRDAAHDVNVLGMCVQWTVTSASITSSVVKNGDLGTPAVYNTLRTDVLGLRERIYRVVATGPGATTTYIGDYPAVLLNAVDEQAALSFIAPASYSEISAANLMVIPISGISGVNWDITTDFAANGQAYQTHSDSIANIGTTVTADYITEIDISAALTGLAAGDYVGLTVTCKNAAHDVYVIGLRFKWL